MIPFDQVIILQHCHRIRRVAGDSLSADEVAYNARGQEFLEIMTRLRDCIWTEEDYYTLCKRKLSQLSFSARSNFTEAPCIMEFRKERDDDAEEASSCDAYNRRFLYALAKETNVPVAKIHAFHDGVQEDEAADLRMNFSPDSQPLWRYVKVPR